MTNWSSSVSKTGFGFLNPASSCLAKKDSFQLEELVHVRIFYCCYSLVLNVEIPEIPEILESCLPVVIGHVVDVAVVLLALHTDSWCYMFLHAVSSDFQMDMTDAI